MKAEYIWFHVMVGIFLLLTIVLCGVNVYYFNQARQNPTEGLSKNAAITMMVLNAVAMLLLLAILIWDIARAITATVYPI